MTKAALRAQRHARGLCLEGNHPTEPGYARCAPCRALRRQQYQLQQKLAVCTTWGDRIMAVLETDEAGPRHALHYSRIAALLDQTNLRRIFNECRRLFLLSRLDQLGNGVYALHNQEDLHA